MVSPPERVCSFYDITGCEGRVFFMMNGVMWDYALGMGGCMKCLNSSLERMNLRSSVFLMQGSFLFRCYCVMNKSI